MRRMPNLGWGVQASLNRRMPSHSNSSLNPIARCLIYVGRAHVVVVFPLLGGHECATDPFCGRLGVCALLGVGCTQAAIKHGSVPPPLPPSRWLPLRIMPRCFPRAWRRRSMTRLRTARPRVGRRQLARERGRLPREAGACSLGPREGPSPVSCMTIARLAGCRSIVAASAG